VGITVTIPIMATFRRALVLAAVLLVMLFFLYPRQNDLGSPRKQSKPPGTPGKEATSEVHKVAGLGDSGFQRMKRPLVAQAPLGSAKKQQQQALAAIARLPVKEQLAFHFPYDVTSKFPGYIWQTWKYTPSSRHFLDKFRPPEASWTEKHPTFVHEVVTDQLALHLIKHLYSAVPDVLEAYLAMPMPILKADFFRYLILLARGGIYADIDTFALQSAVDWIPSVFDVKSVGLVIGIEADPDRLDWAEWYSRRIQFCQWTIQSKPGHPVLLDIVSKITTETLRKKHASILKANHDSVVEWTGPAVWTDSIFSYFNDPEYFDMAGSSENITFKDFTGMRVHKLVGDVVVLPITSFSPGIGHSGAGEVEDPMAYVKHEFEGSWKPESERMIEPEQTEEAAS